MMRKNENKKGNKTNGRGIMKRRNLLARYGGGGRSENLHKL